MANIYDSNPQILGGAGGLGLGGFSGSGLLEGLLFATLLGRRGGLLGGEGSGDLAADAVAAKVVELQNTSDLKAEVMSFKQLYKLKL